MELILTRSAPLLRRVVGKLVSRNVKRATQQIITPGSVEAALPTLLNVFDTLSSLAPTRSSGSSSSSSSSSGKEKEETKSKN